MLAQYCVVQLIACIRVPSLNNIGIDSLQHLPQHPLTVFPRFQPQPFLNSTIQSMSQHRFAS